MEDFPWQENSDLMADGVTMDTLDAGAQTVIQQLLQSMTSKLVLLIFNHLICKYFLFQQVNF